MDREFKIVCIKCGYSDILYFKENTVDILPKDNEIIFSASHEFAKMKCQNCGNLIIESI